MKLEDYLNLSFKNRDRLESDGNWSCYCCRSHGTIAEVEEWVDHGTTALCPKCDIDSLLAGHVENKLLEDICKFAFGKTVG